MVNYAKYISTAVMTTAGDMLIENATPAAARLAAGTAGQVLGVAGSPLLPAWGMGMTLLAATGAAGYSLVNGTGTIISWTAPNDGAVHRVILAGQLRVSGATETGGQIVLTWTLPDASASGNQQVVGGSQAVGVHPINGSFNIMCQANTTVTLTQASALTAGTAVLFAEMWGS